VSEGCRSARHASEGAAETAHRDGGRNAGAVDLHDPGGTNVTRVTRGDGPTVRSESCRHTTPGGAATDAYQPALGVQDLDVFAATEVAGDDDAAIGGGPP
jgi:hypothetical protein